MDRLAISLLGPFGVTLNGEPVAWSGGDATRALLAYLAMHAGVACRREALAGLLWPDYSESAALQNLRQALRRLCQTIGDPEREEDSFLQATRQTIAFTPQCGDWLDVATFREAVDTVRAHPHRDLEHCTPCRQRLEGAVRLYRGGIPGRVLLSQRPL